MILYLISPLMRHQPHAARRYLMYGQLIIRGYDRITLNQAAMRSVFIDAIPISKKKKSV